MVSSPGALSSASLPQSSYPLPLCCVLSGFSHVQLFATLLTIPCQAPLSMGFSRQEYWSGLPCPPPGDLPHPGTEPNALMSPALAGGFFFITSTRWEAHFRLMSFGFLNSDLKPASNESRRRQWHPTPVLLPGKSHGRRSLVGCSPWGH